MIALIIIFIVAITIYIVVKVIKSPTEVKDLAPSVLDISSSKNISSASDSKDTLFGKGESTLSGFYYIKVNDKTGTLSNNYISLISIPGILNFELSVSGPDNKMSVQMRVNTVNPNGGSKEEIFEVPSIPVQKWVYISILRDGRRFDVMYNNQIVASHRLQYYPRVMFSPVVIGSPMIVGSAIHIKMYNRRLNPTEVAEELNSLTDTNGTPNALRSIELPIPSFNISALKTACPPGSDCGTAYTAPKDRMKAWSTPYA